MIKVLIVEDSPTVSLYLEYIFSSDPDIEVVGKLSNGKMAVENIGKYKPDIITMDIDMPVMNGLEATRLIMSTNPVPIIIVTSSRNALKMNISMEALAAGALTVVQKPRGLNSLVDANRKDKMVKLVKTYSQVKVIKRKYTPAEKPPLPHIMDLNQNKELPPVQELINRKYVAIGISTGGPEVLKKIFPFVTNRFPYPILVVQHITDGFLESMVAWLNNFTEATVKVAIHREVLLPGHIYFAPNRFHMGVLSNKIELRKDVKDSIFCPSVAYLFSSLILNHGNDTIAMLLTGMGSDGASELKLLREAGAVTIAQDKASSLVFGMPGEAIKMKGAKYILNPKQLTGIISDINTFI